MSLRRTIVELDPATMNVVEFCRAHGISTWFFWDLRRRYATEGAAALEPRSRAPKRVANKTRPEIEDLIVATRKDLVDDGLDAGPATIHTLLSQRLERVPSEATIWRILTARGFVTAEPRKAPKRTHRRFVAERANECWQLDDTTVHLADGTEVKVLNVIDDHSRLLVASVAAPSCTGAVALRAMADAAAVLGWPERFLSDNARAFRHVLADAVAELGVAAGHSRPYHPQTCGKVERFHQTLKLRLAAHDPAPTLDELQAHLDAFRHLYNHQRPHRAIGRVVPAQAWTNAPKSGPADRPLTTSPTTTTTTVVYDGKVRLGRRHTITIGNAHDGATALAIVTGLTCHIFIDGRLIRALTIDPTRKHQALYNRPGRPTRLP